MWLFGRFAAASSSAATYEEAEEPVSTLINDFGPPVASVTVARQRAAMPSVHLEREIWDVRDASGSEIGPDAPEHGPGAAKVSSAMRFLLRSQRSSHPEDERR